MDDSFTLIAVTFPDFVPGEAQLIQAVLGWGIGRVHVRKPGSTPAEVAALLRQIPENLRLRLSLHDHHQLAAAFPGVRIHLNARNPLPPGDYALPFSRSCHTFAELQMQPTADYSFLSPVYDSISKSGYASAFSDADLIRASRLGILNRRVIALGGVTPERIPALRAIGFGGAAMLGYIWADLNPVNIKHNIDAAIYYSHQR